MISWRAVAVGGALVVTAGAAVVPSSLSAYTASTTNSTDTAASANYFTCTNSVSGNPGGPAAYFAYPFADASGPTALDVSGNARNGTYTSSGVTYSVANTTVCPRDGNKVITLDGSSGFVTSPALGLGANPQVFTVEIRFRTTTKGGRLIGLSNTGLTYPDRLIYLDSAGRLVFGVNAGLLLTTMKTISTPGTTSYADGAWHYAAATLSPAGMALYVDGTLAASDPTVTAAAAPLLSLSPVWRMGYDILAGWPNAPASGYFKGDLAFGAEYTVALTAAQVKAHYIAGI